MILKKYIFKDILKVQFYTFIVLFAVFMCQSIIKILGQASAGSIPVTVVSELVLYSMPTLGFILIPLTLYIGIIVSLSRMSSDSEMVVMRSVGFSGVSFMKVSLVVAVISAILTGINCVYLMPQATLEQKILRQKTQSNPQYLPIESGKFNAFNEYNIYIQDVKSDNQTDEKELGNIYIIKSLDVGSMTQGARDTSFLTANYGQMKFSEDGTRWLSLKDGYLYKTKGINGEANVVKFDTLDVPVLEEQQEGIFDGTMQAVPMNELIKMDDPKAKAEIQWRLAPIFSCIILAIIAVPLSMINPRQGRFARLLPAILIFLCYYLALISMRNLLNSEKISIYPGMYIVPVLFSIFVAFPLNVEKNKFKKLFAKKK